MNLYGFVGNDGVNSWDYLGLTDECSEGEIKFISFTVIIRQGVDNIPFGTKTPSQKIKDALQDGAIDGIGELASGSNLGELLENIQDSVGKLNNFTKLLNQLSTKGFFSVALQVEYACCECPLPGKEWKWGEAKTATSWLLHGEREPQGGLDFNFLKPSTMENFSNLYINSIYELASEIGEECGLDE